jgi:hypothetical protein
VRPIAGHLSRWDRGRVSPTRTSSRLRRLIVPAVMAAVLLPVTTACAAPSAPALVAPAASATVEALPAFTWSPVRHAATYEFQLSADRRFGSIALDQRTANTAATLTKAVADGDYYWRVRAVSKNDRASAWSRLRTLTKDWATAPHLLGPDDGLGISWPSIPLVLRWSTVPHATRYLVSIGTDPSLSSLVIGTASKPVETQGTVFALPGSLSSGTYYWAVTPVDAEGFRGQRSRVGTFAWTWPTTTATRVTDLEDAAEVVDPQLSWDAIPGAARYEVEVNPSADFAVGSRVWSSDAVTGTSVSPVKVLPNNRYFWRVRAFDADGNAGQWNVGPEFTKTFDVVPGLPAIRNLRVLDNTGALVTGGSTKDPVVTWDPVPGASGYEVRGFPWNGSTCNFAAAAWSDSTPTAAWTPIASAPRIGSSTWPTPPAQSGSLSRGNPYCVQVRAYTDRDVLGAAVVGPTTELKPGFTWAPADTAGPAPETQAADYLTPMTGTVTPRTPVFTWRALTGAAGYYVVVARDPQFTKVVDVAFTAIAAYAPRTTYADETTTYYWAVVPKGTDGVTTLPPDQDHPQAFEKRSVPPTLLAPAAGADVPTQPAFRWTAAEGARNYRLQVARDPDFGDLLEDVTTASTAYTTASTYPADTVLYWRVRANDDEGTGVTWSSTGAFRRRLPAPALAPGNPGGGTSIPVLTWAPVPGAVSYDMHVDQADGTTRDFTMRSTAFTPTIFYGTGVWRWKVRANFPSGRTGSVSGGYFPAQSYVRRIDAPVHARGGRSASRLVLSWDPDPAAKQYLVQVSTANGFGHLVDSVRTQGTSWAPDLAKTGYTAHGKLYWRVASIDSGGNVGAFATGRFSAARSLTVVSRGSLRMGRASEVTITLTGTGRRVIRKALVQASGSGVRRTTRHTGRNGTATFRLRPLRRGTVAFVIKAKGYGVTTLRMQVR